MRKFNIATYILIAILIFVFIPLGVAFLLSFNFINTDTTNEWIGFWGGYLGSIFGGAITLYVLFKTLKDGKRLQKRDEKLDYCNRIVEMIASYFHEISLSLIKLNKYYNRVALDIDNLKTLDEVTESIYTIKKYAFVLTAHLDSKIKDKDYKNINEIKIVVENILGLIVPINDSINNNNLNAINQDYFLRILKNIETENNKLIKETTLFLTYNKEM